MLPIGNENNFTLECDYATLLNFINTPVEKNRAIRYNRNIKASLYPLTENFLRSVYLNTDYSNLKDTYNNINCAAGVYSYFLMSYGRTVNAGTTASGATSGNNSSGLNPFGLFNADLGFNLGGISWLWWLLIAAGVYKVVKK
jgi:hypothetical protein